jgi:hypothetical protein
MKLRFGVNMEKELILALRFNTKTGAVTDIEVLDEGDEVILFTVEDLDIELPQELAKYVMSDVIGVA